MARIQHFAGSRAAATPEVQQGAARGEGFSAGSGARAETSRRSCVLVAEDEDQVRDLTIELLAANGFDSIAARHGGEAVTLFSEHRDRIDAVLLDLSMPVMDGVMVLSEMQRQKPSVRVVLTSGYDDSESGLDAERGKSVSFLQKPYRAEKLIAKLRALIDAREN